MNDSEQYLQKKAFYQRLLTLYGRKPVLEALDDINLTVHKLHLANSNRRQGIVATLIEKAEQRGIAINWLSREELSRISRNRKQDQGVAIDLELPSYRAYGDFLANIPQQFRLIAVDGIHNPQNLGMIIRSVCASPMQGLLLSRRGNCEISPLVIKASAGTALKAPIFHCESLLEALQDSQQQNTQIITLNGRATTNLYTFKPSRRAIFVLGNETEGVSAPVTKLADTELSIPMHNGVESLNVAVTAGLLAFSFHTD